MGLNLLLDSADPSAWEYWNDFGIFEGITTNPTLLKKANQSCELNNIERLLQRAEALNFKEIHIQAWGNTSEKLIECGKGIRSLNSRNVRIYVKLPTTDIGTKAAKELISDHVPITLTACYEINQIIVAAALGSDYIAPYLGRINDKSNNGKKKIAAMQKILEGLNSSCKLLVASIRDTSEINYLASKGVSTFTIGEKVASSLFSSEETIRDSKIFEKDSHN